MREKVWETVISVPTGLFPFAPNSWQKWQRRGPELGAWLCRQLDDSLSSTQVYSLGQDWGAAEGGAQVCRLCGCSDPRWFTRITINSCICTDFVQLSPPWTSRLWGAGTTFYSIQGLQGLVQCQLQSRCSIHVEETRLAASLLLLFLTHPCFSSWKELLRASHADARSCCPPPLGCC